MKKIKTFFGTGFMVGVLFLSAPAFAQTAEQQPQANNDQANDIQAFLKKYQKTSPGNNSMQQKTKMYPWRALAGTRQ